MDMEKIIFGFFTVGGLIFVYLVLNQGGGKPATNLATAGTTGAAKVISTLQGR